MFLKFNSNICRVCLEQEGKISIFDKESTAQQYHFCTSLEVFENDELPSSLCNKCYKCLKIANDFKQKAISSNNYLRKFLNTLNNKFSNVIANNKNSLDVDTDELNTLLTFDDDNNDDAVVVGDVDAVNQNSDQLTQNERSIKKETIFHTIIENVNNDDDVDEEMNALHKSSYNIEILKICPSTSKVICTEEGKIHEVENMMSSDIVDIDNNNSITIIENNNKHEEEIEISFIQQQQQEQQQEDGNPEDNRDVNSIEIHKSEFLEIEEIKNSDQGKSPQKQRRIIKRKKYKTDDSILPQPDKESCVCIECDKTFASKPNLMRHLLTHTNEKPYQCTVCGECFTQNGSLKTHMLRHTGERPYECDVCKKTFTRRRILMIHSRIHTGDKPYECEQCKEKFRVKESLRRHNVLRHSKGKLKEYPCSVCDRILSTKYSLNMHSKLHESEKQPTVQCDVCGKSFANKYSLKGHVDTIHTTKASSAVLQSLSSSSLKQRQQCKECKLIYKTKNAYLKHLQKVHNKSRNKKNDNDNLKILQQEKPILKYQCDLCKQIFMKKFRLMQHLLAHEDENNLNYSCRKCEKNFTIRENLVEHLRTHNEFLHKCDECNVGFNTERGLKLHRLNYHKETVNDLNQCDKCNVKFVTGVDLNVHILTKHDKIDIDCDECDEHFTSNRLYKEHVIEHNIIHLT